MGFSALSLGWQGGGEGKIQFKKRPTDQILRSCTTLTPPQAGKLEWLVSSLAGVRGAKGGSVGFPTDAAPQTSPSKRLTFLISCRAKQVTQSVQEPQRKNFLCSPPPRESEKGPKKNWAPTKLLLFSMFGTPPPTQSYFRLCMLTTGT